MNKLIYIFTSIILKWKISKTLTPKGLTAITHVETCDPVVALTFDDGPHPLYTCKLLSILEKYNVRATFFMVGKAAKKYPEVVKMVAGAGHVIGNHSWDHPSLTLISSRFSRMRQMWACASATAPYCKPFFRPPFGSYDARISIDAFLFRYKIILWSVSAQDWISQTSDEIANKITNRLKPGDIMLLHDAICCGSEDVSDREAMLNGLEMALSLLKGRLRFITVPELLKTGKPARHWPR